MTSRPEPRDAAEETPGPAPVPVPPGLVTPGLVTLGSEDAPACSDGGCVW
ncbi:hypothetical protein Misp01_22960 [Microtetraspora sp. NBRC 13810]|nr:hypothetical protein [Microtetraspora sp. NBRC 13810]GLW07166.1 hypothetical protein Misp01_22960 [Microtetraspora sp. NBRC 13810]